MLYIHGEKKGICPNVSILMRAMQDETFDRRYAAHIQRDHQRAWHHGFSSSLDSRSLGTIVVLLLPTNPYRWIPAKMTGTTGDRPRETHVCSSRSEYGMT